MRAHHRGVEETKSLLSQFRLIPRHSQMIYMIQLNEKTQRFFFVFIEWISATPYILGFPPPHSTTSNPLFFLGLPHKIVLNTLLCLEAIQLNNSIISLHFQDICCIIKSTQEANLFLF